MKRPSISFIRRSAGFCLILTMVAAGGADDRGGPVFSGGTGIYAQGLSKSEIRTRFEEERDRIRRTPQEIRQLMNATIADIKKRNLKFRVELNEQMKFRIAEITGASCPDSLEREATVQWSYGNQDWDRLMNIYRSYLGKKKVQ